MNDPIHTTPEPSVTGIRLPHGGPPDMVPFESPSHWERAALVLALVGMLVLGAVIGTGAIRRANGVAMPSAHMTTDGAGSTSR